MNRRVTYLVGLILLVGAVVVLAVVLRQEEPAPTPVADGADVTETATAAATPTAEPTSTATAPAPTATATVTTATATAPAPTETATPAAEEAAYEPAFEPAACQFEVPGGREVECGYLIVPEDRENLDDGDTVRLHVAVFASESETPESAPIVYLAGGPGGDALETVPFVFESRFAPFLENGELIMFDQRGTGYSEPSLACPEYTELSLELLDDVLTPQEAVDVYLEALAACHERLEAEGVDFTAYNSAASAADVRDLRQALGYEEINLFGVSYGTRLAQTIVRDFPEGIRSVTLDSAYPIAANIVLETPANLARALNVFFEGCAADTACQNAYPDLEDRFWELVEATDEEPITVPVQYAFTGEQYDAALVGDDLIGVLFQGLYSAEIIPVLPQVISDTIGGDYGLLGTLLSNFLLNNEFSSVGMQFSVQCHEEIVFAEPAQAEAAVEAYPRLEDFFVSSASVGRAAFDVCAMWEAGQAPPLEEEAVSSDLPTLILAGEYDPITPPSWGESVAAGFSNSMFFTFPGLGHGVSLDGGCPLSVMLAFLDDPTTAPDGACVETMAGPNFRVPGEAVAEVSLEPFTTDI
ncbi:MAG: alpha/beta hydrolase, partial [Candidatus Promineifilaceae bacterium]|nr:alpha/beta hydrolase [Candidatus Promineifilaceae bacterium]